jgi:hypothetical protein
MGWAWLAFDPLPSPNPLTTEDLKPTLRPLRRYFHNQSYTACVAVQYTGFSTKRARNGSMKTTELADYRYNFCDTLCTIICGLSLIFTEFTVLNLNIIVT